MKDLLIYFVVGVCGLAALLVVIYGFRLFMNTTAPITVHEVEDGVHCAISSGGEAIDCWKVGK